MFKKMLIYAVAFVLSAFQFTLPVFADGEINITGDNTYGFRLYSDNADIFNIQNATPGQEWTTQINISNTTKDKLIISLSEIKERTDGSILASYLYLTISTENGVLYDGLYPIGVKPIINRIEIDPLNSRVLYVKCRFEPKAGNNVQNSQLQTTWVFTSSLEHSQEITDKSYTSEHSEQIALPFFAEFNGYDVFCYNELGDLIYTTQNIYPQDNLMIKAPDIEGYEADNAYLSIFGLINGEVSFTYHKISQDATTVNTDKNDNHNVGYITDEKHDKEEINNNDYPTVNEMGTNTIIRNITQNAEKIYRDSINSFMRDKNGNIIFSQDMTEYIHYNNDNSEAEVKREIAQEEKDNAQEEKNDTQEEDDKSSMNKWICEILANTDLIGWWVLFLLIVIAVLTIIIGRWVYKKDNK